MNLFQRWRRWQIVLFSGSFSMLFTAACLYPMTRFDRDGGRWQLVEIGVGLILMGVSYLWPKRA